MLKKFRKGNFPVEKYIVDVNRDIARPSYLTKDSVYRISNGFSNTYPKANTFEVKMTENPIWPPCQVLNFEESQYEAFCEALKKQLVVIQGPPGKDFGTINIVSSL